MSRHTQPATRAVLLAATLMAIAARALFRARALARAPTRQFRVRDVFLCVSTKRARARARRAVDRSVC